MTDHDARAICVVKDHTHHVVRTRNRALPTLGDRENPGGDPNGGPTRRPALLVQASGGPFDAALESPERRVALRRCLSSGDQAPVGNSASEH